MWSKEINRIIKDFDDKSLEAKLASRMVKIDLMSMPLAEWLVRPASDIVDEYVDSAEAASGVALNNLRSHAAGEKLLDELGFHDQDFRLVFDDAIDEFRDSMLVAMKGLTIYLAIQERAKDEMT
tara:strand:- start:493 stop:864 length:372 start_codon:yes stop_codon:yes gene_type:complete